MNSVIYAGNGSYADQPAADGMIFNRALKVFVPDYDGGEIVIIPPNLPHEAKGFGGDGITVLIEQPLLPLKEISSMPDAEGGGIRHAAKQAATFYASDANGREAVLAALGELIVSYILTHRPDGSLSPVIAALREDIDKSVSDSAYSVDVAIRKLPLNYDYVRKLFKKEVGVTPHDYLTHARMKRAKTILLSGVTNRYSNYSITQIAEACGYAEPLYFSRVFKKYYGVAPSFYIKK